MAVRYEYDAEAAARKAANRTRDEQTDAIGEGLAAIAFALLELSAWPEVLSVTVGEPG
ncbi:hypothetical protein GCM10009835_45790 [Planosporangium flavigriseum]